MFGLRNNMAYTERIVTYIPKEWKEFLDLDREGIKEAEFYRGIIETYLERQPDWIKRKKVDK
jgi:hypothetical protein